MPIYYGTQKVNPNGINKAYCGSQLVYQQNQKVVYGVSGLYQSSTTLTRTDDAVGMSWSMVNNEIYSDFDNVFPYNQMARETVDGNVMVYVPEIYWRFNKDASGYITAVAISNQPFTAGANEVIGHTNAFYYSAYKGILDNSKLMSKAGVSPYVNQTRAIYRNLAHANGSGYQIEDVVHTRILDMLWLIEFATKQSEDVMWGYTGYGQTTGATDSLTKPSGQLATKGQMRWHYIEDFVGNGLEYMDGITGTYVTANPSQYSDSQVGTSFSWTGSNGGLLLGLQIANENNPLLIVPKQLSTNPYLTNQYFCDICYIETGNFVGFRGRFDADIARGLFYWGRAAFSNQENVIGSRIIKILS